MENNIDNNNNNKIENEYFETENKKEDIEVVLDSDNYEDEEPEIVGY